MTSADCTLTKERIPLSRDQAVFDVRHAGAAVTLETRAVKAHVGHGFHQFFGKPSGAVALLDNRNQVVFNELTGGIPDQALVIG
jgi:hypothetical protein